MYNSLFHCMVFVWNVCGDHLLCGGFLCWLRSRLQQGWAIREMCAWSLYKLGAIDITWQSNWIKEHEKNFILCSELENHLPRDRWLFPPENYRILKNWMESYDFSQNWYAWFWVSEKNWSKAAIMFSSSCGQILCISKRMSVLQSFSTKSNYFLLHYVERYKTWQQHHIQWLVLRGIMLYCYMSAYHIDDIIMRSFKVL